MKVVFRPEARVELLDAQAWYEARVPGLGAEFARAFAAAEEGCRRVVLRRFPFSLYYRCKDERLLVVAVFHHRRHPRQRGGRD